MAIQRIHQTGLGFIACGLWLMSAGCGPRPDGGAVTESAGQGGGMKRVIILCTGNSCRSQMAEAFWRKHGGADWEVVSAGTRPKGAVYPLAIRAMAEKGIDISRAESKSTGPFIGQKFDLVVTVCDDAEKNCPTFASAAKHLHWPFDDPPKATGTDEQRMQVCRRVRDEIEAKIRSYLGK